MVNLLLRSIEGCIASYLEWTKIGTVKGLVPEVRRAKLLYHLNRLHATSISASIRAVSKTNAYAIPPTSGVGYTLAQEEVKDEGGEQLQVLTRESHGRRQERWLIRRWAGRGTCGALARRG